MSAKSMVPRPRYTLSTMRLIQRGAGSQCDTVCAIILEFVAQSWFCLWGYYRLLIHVNSFFFSFFHIFPVSLRRWTSLQHRMQPSGSNSQHDLFWMRWIEETLSFIFVDSNSSCPLASPASDLDQIPQAYIGTVSSHRSSPSSNRRSLIISWRTSACHVSCLVSHPLFP